MEYNLDPELDPYMDIFGQPTRVNNMRDPFAGYDQWKTASPYDDEPDVVDNCSHVVQNIEYALREWEPPISDRVRQLLESAKDTLNAAAEYIENEI